MRQGVTTPNADKEGSLLSRCVVYYKFMNSNSTLLGTLWPIKFYSEATGQEETEVYWQWKLTHKGAELLNQNL